MEEAREWYERYLELVPGDPEASHMVASLGGAPAPPRAGDAYVRSLFDGFAEDFDRILVDDLHYRAPEHLYREVRRALPKGTRGLNVLDAGCGTGLAGELFRPLARHLEGIDLSREMTKLARARGVYHSLRTAEITRALENARARYDLIVAADVFVYLGDLEPVLRGASHALAPGGHLAFSIECAEGEGYALAPSGRYVHAISYVRRAAEQAGLGEVSGRMATLRKEMGKAVPGYVAVYAKT
jgi:predicted TPR repeat methyltransferase